MKIAILAACVGTLALAQSNLAQAAYAGAAEPKSGVTTANVGPAPAIRLAINNPIPGVDIIVKKHGGGVAKQPSKAGSGLKQQSKQPISDQVQGGSTKNRK